MPPPDGYTIGPMDLQAASNEEVAEAARLQQEIDLERTPEDPAAPIEVIAQQLRARPPGHWRAIFGARDRGGKLVGVGLAGRNLKDTENAHIRWSLVAVRSEHRRHGLGRALFESVVRSCDGDGDDAVFIAQTSDRMPYGEAFAKSIGAKPGLPMKISQLDLRAADAAGVAQWAKIDPPGYRLVRVDDVVPAEMVQPYIDAATGINDMPRGDIAFKDWTMTEAQIRQRESYYQQVGTRWWLLLGIHEETGRGAGFTEVQFDPRNPHSIEQEGTAVVPAHRGHRLALWMKAAMLERILAECTESRFIRTGNANVNAQMLAVNTKLGFTHAWQTNLWQVSVDDARKALAGDSTSARA